jgi:hypothetical protein
MVYVEGMTNPTALLCLLALAGCVLDRGTPADTMPRSSAGAAATADSAIADSVRSSPAIAAHPVIVAGSHGMSARVRWLLSPDRRALLLVEDPAAVEAEPVPNGFIYASEDRGALLQVEDVWDVTPSPDWQWLAYGKSYVLRAGGRDTIDAKQWGPLARRFAELASAAPAGTNGVDAATLEQRFERALQEHSFPVSGMAIVYGTAATHVLELPKLLPGARAFTDTVPPIRFGGWRIRWTRSGDTLGIGEAPRKANDASGVSHWTLVTPMGDNELSAPVATATDSARFTPIRWSEGPSLDISQAVDYKIPRVVEAGGARIVSRDGTIYLTRAGERTERKVGIGLPLAATASGRYIAAIAPRQNAQPNESPSIAVVYEVSP